MRTWTPQTSRSSIRSTGMALWTMLAFTPLAVASIPTYRTVGLTGTDGPFGPNLGAGVTFIGTVDSGSINAAGQVSFRGASTNTGGLPNGVWLRPDATTTSFNQNLALEGSAQPGGGIYASTNSYNSVSLNDNGDVAFRVGASKGAFASNAGTMYRVALAGDIAPGTGNATWSTGPVASGQPLFNRSGQSAFIGALTTGTGSPPVVITSGSNNSTAIFVGTGDNVNNPNQNLAPVVRSGDWFANLGGTSTDTKLNTFSSATMSLNDQGRYVVSNTLQGTAIVTGTGSTSNSVALISNRSGTTDLLARVGNAAPDSTGAASADVYRSFGTSQIAFNNLGHVAFTATLRQGATQTVASALFTDANGGVAGGTLKRIGAAGGPIGSVYAPSDNTTPLPEFSSLTYGNSATFSTTVMNGNDDLLYSANLSSGGQAYLKLDHAGFIHRMFRIGDVAFSPDPLSTGGTGTSTISGAQSLMMNNVGEIAFLANLTGPGVSVGLGNGSILYATDATGALIPIARTGTQFTDGLGNTHTISGINVTGSGSGGQDGHTIALNDLDQLAFSLQFSDGTSGVFVAQVPEPGTLALLSLGLVCVARRKNRGA